MAELTYNEQLVDAGIRHQIGLLRFSGGLRNDINALLDATESDLRAALAKVRSSTDIRTPAGVRRLERLLEEIETVRGAAWKDARAKLAEEIRSLALAEPRFLDGLVRTIVPVDLGTRLPPPDVLRGIVQSRPFQGKTLKAWADDLARADLARLQSQIRIGMVQGESIPQITRRLVGTVSQGGRNGATQLTRNQVQSVVRTAVNGVSNEARREYALANSDIVREELFVATLDHRTTLICQSLDGKRYPIGEGDIPPMHMQCRSFRTLVLRGDPIGERPVREFTERQLVREYARDNNLGRISKRANLPRGTKGPFDAFKRKRMRELTGTTPAKTTYPEFLRRQPASFQDDVLGTTRGRLFREGMEIDRFVDASGSTVTLSQLAKSHADVFRAAGLDPADFKL